MFIPSDLVTSHFIKPVPNMVLKILGIYFTNIGVAISDTHWTSFQVVRNNLCFMHTISEQVYCIM